MAPPVSTWPWHRRVLYAAKPDSWPKLLVPAAFGQALGVATTGGFSGAALALGSAFTLALGLFIVWTNDWADQRVDALKRTMFPGGCSPKTIPDGILAPRTVLALGLSAGGVALAVACLSTYWLGRPYAWAGGALCLALFVAYSLPPLALNYRGGGEGLEALGVGVALPWFHAYLQSGDLIPAYALLLVPALPLALSSALASGLSDQESDHAGGKRTVAALRGNQQTRQLVELSVVVGVALWVVVAWWRPEVPRWLVVPAALVAAYRYVELIQLSPRAQRGAFEAQRAYKGCLHRLLWHSSLALSAAILVALWVG